LRRNQHPDSEGLSAASLDLVSSQNALEHDNRITSSRESQVNLAKQAPSSTTVICSSHMIPAVAPNISSITQSTPLLTPLIPLIPLHPNMGDMPSILPSIPQSPALSQETAPIQGSHQRNRSGTIGGIVTDGLNGSNVSKEDYFSARARQQGVPGSPDDFSGWMSPNPQTPSTPSGLIGRLKNFGKITKRPVSDTPNVSLLGLVTPTVETPTQSEVCEAYNLLAFFLKC